MRNLLSRLSPVLTAFTVMLFTGAVFASVVDVPRIDGYVVIPTADGDHYIEMDMDAEAGSCDVLAESLHTMFTSAEIERNTLLGNPNRATKTNIVCAHRIITTPDTTTIEGVCDIDVDASTTYESVVAACPILQQ